MFTNFESVGGLIETILEIFRDTKPAILSICYELICVPLKVIYPNPTNPQYLPM